MRKRIASIFLVLCMMLSLTPMTFASADNKNPKIVISTETAKAGEEVAVSVSTENNPGVGAMVLKLEYDSSKLQYIGFEDGGLTGWKVVTTAVWIGTEDSSFNGEILKLKFKVLDGATGFASVALKCEDGGAVNFNEEAVPFEVVSGGVQIAAHTHSYKDGVCTVCGEADPDYVETPASPVPTISIKTDSGKPTLKWSAVDGADKYEVYRAISKTGTYSKYYTTTNTSYTNSSAVAGNTYYYRVRAITANGNASEFSVIKSITCDCAQPVVTISTTASSGKPTLKWAAVDGATKYEIWRATSSTGNYTKYYTTTSTSYTNSSAVAGSTYYYKVKAICGKSSYGDSAFSAVKSITCDCAAPVVTISTTASSGKPTLKWSAVDGATKYEIWRATSKDGTYTKMYTTSSTSYTNSSAVAGKTYYYKVKALCGKSNYGDSAFSAIKSITCDCARPVVSITTSSGHPKLSWKAVDGATKYEVYRATSSGGSYTKLGTTSNLSYTNTSAKAGTTYYYKVIAVCGASSYGNSAYSTVVSIKAK